MDPDVLAISGLGAALAAALLGMAASGTSAPIASAFTAPHAATAAALCDESDPYELLAAALGVDASCGDVTGWPGDEDDGTEGRR